MAQSLSLIEKLSHSTVRIECDFPDGSRGTGTGFFYNLKHSEKDKYVPVIITNKHVVEGSIKCMFLLTLMNFENLPDYGNKKGFEIGDIKKSWRFHPDVNVDLCVLPIVPLIKMAESQGISFFYTHLDDSLLPTESEINDFIGLEEVLMVGYPNGLWDEVNNLPIFRRGVLATSYNMNWNGKKEFLIDAACFPGSSGSPILLYNPGSYQTRTCHYSGSTRVKLLGILYAGPQHTLEGDIKIVNVPIRQKPIMVAGIPNNLGIGIKSEKIKDFESMF